MTGFALALEQRRWDLVSLYLLLGVARAAEAMPRESLEELLNLLAGDKEGGRPGGRGRLSRGRR